MTLLFRLAEWHGLAKLRMHTDSTLSHLDSATTTLGQELRRFSRVTCSSFRTVELPREAAARGRRQARQNAKQTGPHPVSSIPEADPANTAPPTLAEPSPAATGKKKKLFNIRTYKVHALGDYVATIQLFGTTDSYSSQTVSGMLLLLAHPLKLACRASLNIVASRSSMAEQIRMQPFDRWLSTSAERLGFYEHAGQNY